LGSLRVALCATNLGSTPIGGGETFVVGLANALAERDDVRCGVVIPKAGAKRLRTVLSPEVQRIEIAEWRGWRRVLADYVGIDAIVHDFEPDVVHYPHEWCPRSRYPTVLTIQNVWWMHPQGDRYSVRGQGLRMLTRHTQQRASAIGAVSGTARDLWCALTGREKSAVTVIPEGVDLLDRGEADRRSEDNEFILAIAGETRHKNLELARRAFLQVRAAAPDVRLLVAGVCRPDEPGIRHLGWVERRELLELMAAARLVLYISGIESFGLPAFEALAMGTRCVVLEGTPMSEELSGLVIAVAPEESQIANATLRGMAAGPLNESIRSQVRRRYSWHACAAAWHRTYQKAVGELPS